ncbi:hypothetical protein V6N13_034874 [Hibiscus sabdariffa]
MPHTLISSAWPRSPFPRLSRLISAATSSDPSDHLSSSFRLASFLLSSRVVVLLQLSYLFVALSDSIHQVKGLESFPERAFFIERESLAHRGRVRALARYGLRGSDSPSGAHQISINNLEGWLSGLRHWFAKSTYKKIVSWVRIPFPPARKWNGRAKLRERKNLLVESPGGQNSTT